jgi:hypothetical protein
VLDCEVVGSRLSNGKVTTRWSKKEWKEKERKGKGERERERERGRGEEGRGRVKGEGEWRDLLSCRKGLIMRDFFVFPSPLRLFAFSKLSLSCGCGRGWLSSLLLLEGLGVFDCEDFFICTWNLGREWEREKKWKMSERVRGRSFWMVKPSSWFVLEKEKKERTRGRQRGHKVPSRWETDFEFEPCHEKRERETRRKGGERLEKALQNPRCLSLSLALPLSHRISNTLPFRPPRKGLWEGVVSVADPTSREGRRGRRDSRGGGHGRCSGGNELLLEGSKLFQKERDWSREWERERERKRVLLSLTKKLEIWAWMTTEWHVSRRICGKNSRLFLRWVLFIFFCFLWKRQKIMTFIWLSLRIRKFRLVSVCGQ